MIVFDVSKNPNVFLSVSQSVYSFSISFSRQRNINTILNYVIVDSEQVATKKDPTRSIQIAGLCDIIMYFNRKKVEIGETVDNSKVFLKVEFSSVL